LRSCSSSATNQPTNQPTPVAALPPPFSLIHRVRPALLHLTLSLHCTAPGWLVSGQAVGRAGRRSGRQGWASTPTGVRVDAHESESVVIRTRLSYAAETIQACCYALSDWASYRQSSLAGVVTKYKVQFSASIRVL
jgi:hypothetical protein